MSAPHALASLVGRWSGTNHLWLSPAGPARECATSAAVELAAHGHGLVFRYTWSTDGSAQEGLLLLGLDSKVGRVTAAWLDSWHMAHVVMACEGSVTDEGGASVLGAYAAPPGPDWGWRIALEPRGADACRLWMFNIPPGGSEELAVRADYSRVR